jgi:apolipoprotein N-acyltransferase
VPWLAAVDRARSWRGAFAVGLATTLVFVVGVFAWFGRAIADYAALPPWAGFAALVLAAPVLEPQFVVVSLARHRARLGRAGFASTAAVTAGTYVGAEWLLPKLFGDTLGHGFYASPWLRQAADLAGAPGLTVVIVVANDCVLEALRRRRGRGAWRPLAAVAATIAALAAYGAVRCRQLEARLRDVAPVTVAVVQADIGQYDRLRAELGTYGAVRRILDAHFALSADVLGRAHPDVLLWPETVYPTTFGTPKSEDGAAFDREISGFVARVNVPLVFGSYDVDADGEYNVAVFLEPETDRRASFDAYRKMSLFPLIELVPPLLDRPFVRRALPWLGTWRPGTTADVMTLGLRDGRRLRVAPLVCYDDVDPGHAVAAVRHGAEVVFTLSNDSWFADGAGPMLHFVVSAFRSLETRRPQVRATNTGISAVITPTGDIVAVAGVHERAALVAGVTPVDDVTTLVVLWGEWLAPVALAVAAVLLARATLAGRGPVV